MHQASARGRELAVPPGAAYGELDALEIDVEIDDERHVRCVRHRSSTFVMTAELSELGSPLPPPASVVP
jgi:hypothetical protein